MLRIRKEQKEQLREREIRAFEEDMLKHLGILFPAYCEAFGPAALRRMVRLGIERAARYGIVSERGVCVYIDAMFAFGRDFDTDPSIPWAGEILGRKSLETEVLRVDELVDEGLERLEEARGLRAEEIPS